MDYKDFFPPNNFLRGGDLSKVVTEEGLETYFCLQVSILFLNFGVVSVIVLSINIKTVEENL